MIGEKEDARGRTSVRRIIMQTIVRERFMVDLSRLSVFKQLTVASPDKNKAAGNFEELLSVHGLIKQQTTRTRFCSGTCVVMCFFVFNCLYKKRCHPAGWL